MIELPVIQGTIRRRILVNYRVDPEVMARQLPAPFSPKLHEGQAIGGICLIRLEHIRPRFAPWMPGISSENAAHRIAVTWTDTAGQPREGVYIPRRDTGSWWNHVAGGRVFPGEHHLADFQVDDTVAEVSLRMTSRDGSVRVAVHARESDRMPETSRFRSIERASEFFQAGSLGYSAAASGDHLDGITLATSTWQISPLDTLSAESSWFDDRARFPAGSVAFDCALIMRDILHEWHAEPRLPLCR